MREQEEPSLVRRGGCEAELEPTKARYRPFNGPIRRAEAAVGVYSSGESPGRLYLTKPSQVTETWRTRGFCVQDSPFVILSWIFLPFLNGS